MLVISALDVHIVLNHYVIILSRLLSNSHFPLSLYLSLVFLTGSFSPPCHLSTSPCFLASSLHCRLLSAPHLISPSLLACFSLVFLADPSLHPISSLHLSLLACLSLVFLADPSPPPSHLSCLLACLLACLLTSNLL